MHVAALITNYNAWPLTSKAITELRRWSDGEVSKVVVVDDASDAPLPGGLSGPAPDEATAAASDLTAMQNQLHRWYAAHALRAQARRWREITAHELRHA